MRTVRRYSVHSYSLNGLYKSKSAFLLLRFDVQHFTIFYSHFKLKVARPTFSFAILPRMLNNINRWSHMPYHSDRA